MEQLEQWFREKQAERTIQALKKNNFEGLYVSDSKAALEEVMKRIPDGASVGIGGSVTLAQIGLLDALKNRKIQFIWPQQQAKSDEERLELFRKCFSTDVAMSVAIDAAQILGAYGYVKEFPSERYIRDAKSMQIVEGTNQIQRVIIARSLLH